MDGKVGKNTDSTSQYRVTFRVLCDDDAFSSLGLIGNTSALGSWNLSNMIRLTKVDGWKPSGHMDERHAVAAWISNDIEVTCVDDGRGGYRMVPFRYRIVANGGRSSPNKRPLLWDVQSRHVLDMPANGYVYTIMNNQIRKCLDILYTILYL